MMKLAVTLFLGLTLGACGSDGGAAGAGGGAGSGGGASSAPPTFARVKAEIIAPSCALSSSCHKGTGKAAMALDLDPYKALMGDAGTGKAACEFPSMKLVVPGMPEQSLVYLKVTTPPAGAPDAMCAGTGGKNERMPMSSDALEPARLALLKDWIKAGAKND